MDEVSTTMFGKSANWFGVLALLVLIACSSGRPVESRARTDFSSRFPNCEIIFVKIIEDEVVARSFEIAYRKQGSDLQQMTEIQYIKYDDGWKISPEPTPLR